MGHWGLNADALREMDCSEHICYDASRSGLGSLRKTSFAGPMPLSYLVLSDLDGGPKICIPQVPPPAKNLRGSQTQNKTPLGCGGSVNSRCVLTVLRALSWKETELKDAGWDGKLVRSPGS